MLSIINFNERKKYEVGSWNTIKFQYIYTYDRLTEYEYKAIKIKINKNGLRFRRKVIRRKKECEIKMLVLEK